MGQRMPDERPWPRYRSHKIVSALRIMTTTPYPDGCVLVTFDGHPALKLDAKMVVRYQPVAHDYLVEYEDGYRSISPRTAFEAGYTRIE